MTQKNNEKKFQINEVVFAKVKGHYHWPAKVIDIDEKTYKNSTKYKVCFFKTNEINMLNNDELCLFLENKTKFSQKKATNKDFQLAINEAEKYIALNVKSKIKISNQRTPEQSLKKPKVSVTSSKTPITRISTCDQAVNTPVYMDMKYQLDALTDKCIDLEKSLTEKNSIPSDNSKVPNFQTQILLDELEKYKAENESLKTVLSLLQTDYSELEKKLSAANEFQTKCLTCFPDISQAHSNISNNSWIDAGRSKKLLKLNETNQKDQIKNNNFLSSNRFQILADEHMFDEAEVDESIKQKVNKENKDKILLCSDSHGRDLVCHLNQYIGSSDAYAFITPGGTSKEVLKKETIRTEISDRKNSLIILCGANDVAKNEGQEVIANIRTILDEVIDNKVYLVDIPHRYDLAHWSCVNREIEKTNTILKRLCGNYRNTVLIEASQADRHFHTKHGLHLNARGKRWLACQIFRAMKGESERTSSFRHAEEVDPDRHAEEVEPDRHAEEVDPDRHAEEVDSKDLSHSDAENAELRLFSPLVSPGLQSSTPSAFQCDVSLVECESVSNKKSVNPECSPTIEQGHLVSKYVPNKPITPKNFKVVEQNDVFLTNIEGLNLSK